MFAILFEVGWFGFGAAGGLIPEVRLGVVRLAFTRGYFADALARAAAAVKGRAQ